MFTKEEFLKKVGSHIEVAIRQKQSVLTFKGYIKIADDTNLTLISLNGEMNIPLENIEVYRADDTLYLSVANGAMAMNLKEDEYIQAIKAATISAAAFGTVVQLEDGLRMYAAVGANVSRVNNDGTEATALPVGGNVLQFIKNKEQSQIYILNAESGKELKKIVIATDTALVEVSGLTDKTSKVLFNELEEKLYALVPIPDANVVEEREVATIATIAKSINLSANVLEFKLYEAKNLLVVTTKETINTADVFELRFYDLMLDAPVVKYSKVLDEEPKGLVIKDDKVYIAIGQNIRVFEIDELGKLNLVDEIKFDFDITDILYVANDFVLKTATDIYIWKNIKPYKKLRKMELAIIGSDMIKEIEIIAIP